MAWIHQFSGKAMAHALRISRRELLRSVRRQFRCSLRAWLARERLRRARQLLRARRLTIKEIAHALGYSRAANFIRAFARALGVPPEFWRRRHVVPK